VLLLRTLPMLEGLGPVQLAAIAQHAQERFFPMGTTIRAATERTEAIHLVVECEVEVVRGGGPAKRAQPGDAIGFIQMLSRSEQPYEIRAVTDTVTLEFDWDAQIDVCEEHFPVVMQYVRYLARAMVTKFRRLQSPSLSPILLIAEQTFKQALNFNERVVVLSRSRAFSSGCLDALAELAQHVEEVRWRDEEAVWSIEDAAENFYLLASGSVRCSLSPDTDFTTHAGRTIGMHEALYDGKRWYDVQSNGNTIALRVEIEPFIDILEDHFDLALDFMASLASDLVQIQSPDRQPTKTR
jgi:CRP-like cAMP-binding protein